MVGAITGTLKQLLIVVGKVIGLKDTHSAERSKSWWSKTKMSELKLRSKVIANISYLTIMLTGRTPHDNAPCGVE